MTITLTNIFPLISVNLLALHNIYRPWYSTPTPNLTAANTTSFANNI